MKKRILSLLVALTLCVGLCVPAVAAEPYTVTINEDGITISIHNVVRESVFNAPIGYDYENDEYIVEEKTIYWMPVSGAYLSIDFDESVYPGSDHWINIGLADENVYGVFDTAYTMMDTGAVEYRWGTHALWYATRTELNHYPLDGSNIRYSVENEDGMIEYVDETIDESWFICWLIGQNPEDPHTAIYFGFVDDEITTPESPTWWAVPFVETAIEAGILPEELQSEYTTPAVRSEFCALAVALYETVTGEEITERKSFSDTDDVNVEKMGALNIVQGVGDDKFDPDAKLTREQAATMLSRLADAIGQPLPKQAPTFADNANAHTWATEAIGQMQSTGIMQGTGNNKFSPRDVYTREQCIITMVRMLEYLK